MSESGWGWTREVWGGGGVPEMHVGVVRKNKKVNLFFLFFFFVLRTKRNPQERNLTES